MTTQEKIEEFRKSQEEALKAFLSDFYEHDEIQEVKNLLRKEITRIGKNRQNAIHGHNFGLTAENAVKMAQDEKMDIVLNTRKEGFNGKKFKTGNYRFKKMFHKPSGEKIWFAVIEDDEGFHTFKVDKMVSIRAA